MSTAYPDPFDMKSPWDEPDDIPTNTEAPVTTPAPATPMGRKFKIGVTLKAANGFDAEWLTPTVFGDTPEETAEDAAALLTAMKNAGLIDLVSKAADYTRSQYKGGPAKGASAAPKRFEDGKVVSSGGGTERKGTTTCEHGDRTYRSGGTWEAMFCPARDKSEQCEPAWLNKKTGAFEVR